MRPGDVPLPDAVPIPGACFTDLHVCVDVLAGFPGLDLWDHALWDVGQWETGTTWIDIAADITGLVLTQTEGEASQVQFQLRNDSLRYSLANLSDPVGGRVLVWTGSGPLAEWKFSGRLTRWDESYTTTPDRELQQATASVDVEAFDRIFLANQGIDGYSYSLGPEGQRTPQRLAYLAALVGWQDTKLDQSVMPHRSLASTNPLWESMQITAESDGGTLTVDNDGSLLYLDRDSYRLGRGDHAQPFVVFSDSCAPGTVAYADGSPRSSDAMIRNQVRLTNVDQAAVTATDQASVSAKGRRLLNLEAETWADLAMAQGLADDLLARDVRSTYFLDPIRVPIAPCPNLRIGDQVRAIRTLPSGTRLDANLRVTGLAWSIAPGSELLEVTTAPVSAFNVYGRWDDDLWALAGSPAETDALWTY